MIDTQLLFFTASAALLLAMPGPTNALLMTAGALSGARRSLPLLAFEMTGYLLAVVSLMILDGLAGGFRQELSLLLKALAAIVMIVTAIKIWRKTQSEPAHVASPSGSSVFLLSLFNPKSLVMVFGISLPARNISEITMAAAILAALVFFSGTAWILAGASARKLPNLPHKWLARISSFILSGFAAYFTATVISAVMTRSWA